MLCFILYTSVVKNKRPLPRTTTTDGRDGRTEDDDDDGTDDGRTEDRTEDDDDDGWRTTDAADGRRTTDADDGRTTNLNNYHISNEFQWFLSFHESNLGIKHTLRPWICTIFCMSKATYISNGFRMLWDRLVAQNTLKTLFYFSYLFIFFIFFDFYKRSSGA